MSWGLLVEQFIAFPKTPHLQLICQIQFRWPSLLWARDSCRHAAQQWGCSLLQRCAKQWDLVLASQIKWRVIMINNTHWPKYDHITFIFSGKASYATNTWELRTSLPPLSLHLCKVSSILLVTAISGQDVTCGFSKTHQHLCHGHIFWMFFHCTFLY